MLLWLGVVFAASRDHAGEDEVHLIVRLDVGAGLRRARPALFTFLTITRINAKADGRTNAVQINASG